MSDTLRNTKIAGGVLGALLIFLLANWATGLYFLPKGEEGHGEEAEAERGFVVLAEGEGEGGGEAEAAPEVSLNDLLLAADVEKGAKLFAKCKACHKLTEGANATGPTLYAVVGRAIAGVEGFGYSDALAGMDGSWTPEALDAWLESPKTFAPGNKMTFKGMAKPTDRANMIAYLATIGGDGLVLEEAAAEEAPAATEQPATDTAATEAPAATEQPATDTAATEAPAATEQPAADTAATEAPAATEQPATDTAAEEAPAATDMAMAGDPVAGERVFKKCKACHAVEPDRNKTGPSLFGIVGRDVAAAADFRYSDAMQAMGGSWTPDRLDAFLIKPKEYLPGTRMSFSGLRKEADRTNLIAYLATLK